MNVAFNPVANVPVRMSVQDFLDWADVTDGRWELVDGEPRPMTPPLRTHGAIAGELAGHLATFFRESSSSWSVIIEAGIVPRMLAAHNMRVADLAVARTPYDTEERAVSDPVLIVEILSPGNQSDTWANVWTYTSIPSVQEILVLRGNVICAEVLRRSPDGRWPGEPVTLAEGDLVLDSIGFTVPLAALYRTTRLAAR